MDLTELLPKFAQVTDKLTLIRSMSYTPIGLFNHTAAIYQMHTGYTADKVSPSGQLEPPTPKDFPTFGSQHHPAQAADSADAAVRDDAAAAAREQRGRTRRAPPASWAARTIRTTCFRPATTWTWPRWKRSRSTICTLRPEVSAARLERRAQLRDLINDGMPEIDKAVAKYDLDKYYDTALSLIISRPGPRGVSTLSKEDDDAARALRPQHVRPKLLARSPAGRSRHARGRSDLAEGRQQRQPLVGRARRSDRPHEEASRRRCSTPACRALIADLDERGLLDETLVVAVGEFGRSPQRGVSTTGNGNSDDGRDHWPYCYTAVRRRRRHQARLRLRQERQDGLGPARKPGPSDRTAGHDLPRRRHQPADDRLQPPEPAARAGEGGSGDEAVCVAIRDSANQRRRPWCADVR